MIVGGGDRGASASERVTEDHNTVLQVNRVPSDLAQYIRLLFFDNFLMYDIVQQAVPDNFDMDWFTIVMMRWGGVILVSLRIITQ